MAYAPPNEDTVCVVGGLGTQLGASQLNGSGATKAVWDAGSPSDFMGVNGGPISTAACAFTKATKNFNATDIGLNVVVGTLAQVIGGDGGHVTAGIYEVTTVTDDDNIIMAQVDDDGTNDTNVAVIVGGALSHASGVAVAGIQEALDQPLNLATTYNRYIYLNVPTTTIVSTIGHDVNSGRDDSQLYVIGYNATLTAEAEVIIYTTTELTSGLLLIAGAIKKSIWKKIDFHAGGKDATRAVYGVNNTVNTAENHTFVSCKFRGASADGVQYAGFHLAFINCEFHSNGGYGLETTARQNCLIHSCTFHDNDNHGAHLNSTYNAVINSLFFDNGKDGSGSGLYMRSSGDLAWIVGNTFHGNADDGLYVIANCDNLTILNNTSVGNGGYGYNIAADAVKFFGWNHASVNTTAHTNKVADGSFADWMQGNNKNDTTAAADIFTNVGDGTEDFTPKSGTDIVDTGLGRTA